MAKKVNLNTATENALMQMDGMTEEMAKKLLKLRQQQGGSFKSIAEVNNFRIFPGRSREELMGHFTV